MRSAYCENLYRQGEVKCIDEEILFEILQVEMV